MKILQLQKDGVTRWEARIPDQCLNCNFPRERCRKIHFHSQLNKKTDYHRYCYMRIKLGLSHRVWKKKVIEVQGLVEEFLNREGAKG